MISANTVLGNRYRLISVLATGGMGKIWRAWDKRHNQVVAVKVLKEELVGQQVFLSRLRAEANNASRIHHPALAAVYEYGETEGQGWIAMELVEGRPLSDLLAGGKTLPLERLARIMVQIAGGLQACHDKQIVHRDVKPSNILVSDTDTAKLTDFGISLAPGREALTAAGMVMGTAQYLPPEQAVGNTATPAGDLYALGVICYETLAGKRPFTGATQVEIALAHVKQAVPPLPETVPAPVAAMIMQMLAKEPASRPPRAAAVASAFEYLLQGQPWPPDLLRPVALAAAPPKTSPTPTINPISQSGRPGLVAKPNFAGASRPTVAAYSHPGVGADTFRKTTPGARPGVGTSGGSVLPGASAARTHGANPRAGARRKNGTSSAPWRPTGALPPSFAPRQGANHPAAPNQTVPSSPAVAQAGGGHLANGSPTGHLTADRTPVNDLPPGHAPASAGQTTTNHGGPGPAPQRAPRANSQGTSLGNKVNYVNPGRGQKDGTNTKKRILISAIVAVVAVLVAIVGLLFSGQKATALGRVEVQPVVTQKVYPQVYSKRLWLAPTGQLANNFNAPTGQENGEE